MMNGEGANARAQVLGWLKEDGHILIRPPVQGPRADALRELEEEGLVRIDVASLEQETLYRAVYTP